MATLEQQRAADTWQCAGGRNADFVNLAKSLPALIMNSGLMQVAAFLREKKGAHEQLNADLRRWLRLRFPGTFATDDFESFMSALHKADSLTFQAITAEAFAWLRWLRQMAGARLNGGG